MRRSNGSSPFNLASVPDADRDRQKTHKRKRSNDNSHDEEHKRTKVDKHPANNNIAATTSKSNSETLVDLAAEKSGVRYNIPHAYSDFFLYKFTNSLIFEKNPEETNSAQNSPAAGKQLFRKLIGNSNIRYRFTRFTAVIIFFEFY